MGLWTTASASTSRTSPLPVTTTTGTDRTDRTLSSRFCCERNSQHTHYRHYQIQDDEGGCHPGQAMECPAAVLSAYNRLAFIQQQLRKGLAGVGLVINH